MSQGTRGSGAGALHGHRAGFASRAAAAVIDLAVVLLLEVALLLVTSLVHYVIAGPPFTFPILRRFSVAGLGTAVAVAYLTCGWAIAGRTAGMQILGLRLVVSAGRPPSSARSLLRAVLCVGFPIGLLWALVSRRNASVQDLLMRTTVIYDWSYGSPARREPLSDATAAGDASGIVPTENRAPAGSD